MMSKTRAIDPDYPPRALMRADPNDRLAVSLGLCVIANRSGIRPLEYKVLVRVEKPAEKTKGGIFIPEETKERDAAAAMEGVLVDMSPLAFSYEDNAPKPDIGATVLFARYSGVTLDGKDGEKYRLMNDKDVVGVKSNG